MYIDRREDEECMSAALPCFGVACAVFTADYTGPQFCLDSSFSGVCVCVCLIFVLLIVCVCVLSLALGEGLYRCSVMVYFCSHSLVVFEWVCVSLCLCVCVCMDECIKGY